MHCWPSRRSSSRHQYSMSHARTHTHTHTHTYTHTHIHTHTQTHIHTHTQTHTHVNTHLTLLQIVYVMPSTSGRAATYPKRSDKLKFFNELKDLRDRLRREREETKPVTPAPQGSSTSQTSLTTSNSAEPLSDTRVQQVPVIVSNTNGNGVSTSQIVPSGTTTPRQTAAEVPEASLQQPTPSHAEVAPPHDDHIIRSPYF